MKNRRLEPAFPVLFLGLCLGLAGCGSSPSGNNPPINPGTVTIAAPTSGATIAAMPMAVTLNLLNGATLANIKVTLDGADITSKFTAAAGGTTTAQVSGSRVYIGNNRIEVIVGTGAGAQTVKAQFTYDPSTAVGNSGGSGDEGAPGGLGSIAADLADVIPIQTRVRMTNQNGQRVWGVQIGQKAYPDPNGNTDGFQVLAFRRSDLTLVYNNSFDTTDDTGQQNFAAAIDPATNAAACGIGGCLEIVQSLDTIGDNPCQDGQNPNCYTSPDNYAENFQAIGGTNFWEPGFSDAADVGYSLIGNVGGAGLHAGSSFQRLTCAVGGCLTTVIPSQTNQAFLNGFAPNGADGTLPNLNGSGSPGTTDVPATANMPEMIVSNNGAMAGELILDNTNKYTFTYVNPPVHFQMGVAPDDSSRRVVIIDGFGSTPQQVIESNPLPPNPDGSPAGGFFLVVLNATTLQPADVETITVNGAACPTAPGVNYCLVNGKKVWHLDSLSYEITQQYNSRNYLFFLTSIGNLNHNFTLTDASGYKYNEQDEWDRIAQSIQDIGGTYSTFVSLNNQAFAWNPYDQYTPNTVPQDDYSLVGQWWLTNNGAVPNPYAMEVSSQISRQTTANPVPSNVQGALEVENDGYYRVMLHTKYAGLLPKIAFTMTSAPPIRT